MASAEDCVWGRYDSTQINYAAGTLNGEVHLVLRGMSESNGGMIASGTATLTAEYLSDKDVFYTSLLASSPAPE